jgi:hypothetical protein
MKILIAITSCKAHEDAGLNQPMRDTWLPEATALGMDYKFFLGSGAVPKDDVVVFDCDDSLGGVQKKLQLKVKWAYDREYDFVFCCFPDTYVCPKRLLMCIGPDYVGANYTHETLGSYCQGGAGYSLSRFAMKFIIDYTRPLTHRDGSLFPYADGGDDAWAGQALHRVGIPVTHNGDFKISGGSEDGPRHGNTVVASHLSYSNGMVAGYKPEQMYSKHQEYLDSGKTHERNLRLDPSRT